MVATGGNKPYQCTGRNGYRNNAVAARLIVSVYNRGRNRGRRSAKSRTDQGRDGAIRGASSARLRVTAMR